MSSDKNACGVGSRAGDELMEGSLYCTVFQSMGFVVIQNCFLIILIYLLWDLGEATYALQTSNFLSLNEENCPHLTRLLWKLGKIVIEENLAQL